MSKTQRECAGRSGHRVSGSALAAESPRSAKRSRREEAEFSPHPDEAGGQIVACCPIGVENLKQTGHVNPGLIHGMQHQGGVVFHPDFILI